MIATLKSGLARVRASRGDGPLLPPALLKSLLPLVVLAVGVTALVLMFLWRDQSSYKPVFGAREKVAVGDMVAVLDAEHIAYRIHPESGQVLATIYSPEVLSAQRVYLERVTAGTIAYSVSEISAARERLQHLH